jgi:hypothetical protein
MQAKQPLPTEQYLLNTYGPLMTTEQLAKLLNRSCEGLRITIRGNNSLGEVLTQAKVKIGRRVHFKIAGVAALLDGRI